MQDDGDPDMAPVGVAHACRARGDKADMSFTKVGSGSLRIIGLNFLLR
jgi:hypothetical protein